MAWVVTAVAVAIELGTAAAIFTAIAEVGIAMQVVGKVTKSKELMKVGGVMSLVGGIGSLATSAFSAMSAAGAAEGGVGVAEGAAAGAFSDVAGEQFALEAGMDAAGSGFGAAGAVPAAAAATTYPVAIGTGGGLLQQGAEQAATPVGASTAPVGGGSGLNPQSATEMFNANMAAAAPAPSATGAAFDVTTAGGVAAPADSSAFGIKQWFDGLDKATQGKVLNGAMQIGGQAVGGLFNGWSEEQKLALESQRQSLLQKETAQRQANANAQPTVAAYVKPTGMMGT